MHKKIINSNHTIYHLVTYWIDNKAALEHLEINNYNKNEREKYKLLIIFIDLTNKIKNYS